MHPYRLTPDPETRATDAAADAQLKAQFAVFEAEKALGKAEAALHVATSMFYGVEKAETERIEAEADRQGATAPDGEQG